MPDLWVPTGQGTSPDSSRFRLADTSDRTKLTALSQAALARGRNGNTSGDSNASVVRQMRLNRQANAQKTGSADITMATGRPRNPMWYWEQNNLPFDVSKDDDLRTIRKWCRLIYLTNPVIASAIDIYARFPLVSMELTSKDQRLTDFYNDQFMEDGLDYEEYLIDVGKSYWILGEAWPMGSFHELMGVWEDDEILNPDDINVIHSPFEREPRYEMALPQAWRDILKDRKPLPEYQALIENYPELAQYTDSEKKLPVSSILLRQLKFKADLFNPRGVPILMRAFRSVIQEEMLNAAQDAIADRLYTPLILAKLGASATDLGTKDPWIPTEDDRAEFEEALDAALAGDFRMLTHHFAVDISSVFGRENMPNLDNDFSRLTKKQLQVFGLSETMLSGSSQGQTYAADALNRDLVGQLLTTYQKLLRKLYRHRALVVAEAQQHYDFEKRGDKRYPIMEEVLEVDDGTGEARIVQQPKLLVPDMRMRNATLQDEESQRQFLEALRGAGIPISMGTRLTNVPVDLDDEVERTAQEQIDQAVKAQEVRRDTYIRLRDEGLPIPEDLAKDFEPKAIQEQKPQAVQEVLPLIGTEAPSTDALAPTQQPMEPGEGRPAVAPQPQGEGRVVPLPRNRMRPAESDEKREEMPKAGLKSPRHIGKRAILDPDKPLDEQLGDQKVG